jgi:hypothetical protein
VLPKNSKSAEEIEGFAIHRAVHPDFPAFISKSKVNALLFSAEWNERRRAPRLRAYLKKALELSGLAWTSHHSGLNCSPGFKARFLDW